MKSIVLSLVLLFACVAHADVARSFPAGAGARYAFTSNVGSAALTISIVESSASRVVVEYYFARGGLFGSSLWLQVVLDVSGKPALLEGYMLTAEGRAAERIPTELLRGLEDVAVADFLFSSPGELERMKRGDESVSVPAAAQPIKATRYEVVSGGSTLSFWLSDEAKPLGLVKLRSRGAKVSANYDVALEAILTHVGARIDRRSAVPLTAEGRALLQTKVP